MNIFELNNTQQSHIRGCIGEKIFSINREHIKNIILKKLGELWNISPSFHDFCGIVNGEAILLTKTFGEFIIEDARYIESDKLESNEWFYAPKHIVEKIRNIKEIHEIIENAGTIPDYNFNVYKSTKNIDVTYTFKIKYQNNKEEFIIKKITRTIPVIEDFKTVIIEVKSYKDGKYKLSKGQMECRKLQEEGILFYFIVRLDFDYNISNKVKIII